MKAFIIFTALFILYGCNHSSINDADKRNENWTWFVDAKTGNGQWIPNTERHSKNVPDGTYTQFYFNGNMRTIGEIINGKNSDTTYWCDLNGRFDFYDIQINESLTRYFNIKEGAKKIYSATGKIRQEGFVANHHIGDKWIDYYNNGNVQSTRNFIRDTGWFVNYYENGALKDSSYFEGKNNRFIIKEWFENGQISRSCEFKNGNFNGIRKTYYENGQIKDSCLAINGLKEGRAIDWYENGKIHQVCNYYHNKTTGEAISYYESGKIHVVTNMKDDMPEGEYKEFDEKGNVINDAFFKNGERIK